MEYLSSARRQATFKRRHDTDAGREGTLMGRRQGSWVHRIDTSPRTGIGEGAAIRQTWRPAVVCPVGEDELIAAQA